MASVHLLSSAGCCVGQALLMSMLQLQSPVRHVAEAQTAVFLGVAAAVTVLSLSCLNSSSSNGGGGGGGGAECAVYYGSAAVPRVAAAGALVWSIVLYASSLGCQPWSGGGGISLGLRGQSGLTASATMTLVPWIIMKALVQTCGDAWRVQLCAGVRIETNADVTASTITAKCDHIDASLSASASVAAISLVFAWVGGVLAPARHNNDGRKKGGGQNSNNNKKSKKKQAAVFCGRILVLLAASVATAGPFVVRVETSSYFRFMKIISAVQVWALQPADVRVTPPASFYWVCAGFSASSLLSGGWAVVAMLRQRRRAAKNAMMMPTSSTTATTTATMMMMPTSAWLTSTAATATANTTSTTTTTRPLMMRFNANNNNSNNKSSSSSILRRLLD
jgi:hypothetical protein